MSQRGRVKRDKWREELLQAEAEYASWSKKVFALQQEQDMFRARERLLLQMIDGLRVVADAMADYITQQQQQQASCNAWQHQQLCMALTNLIESSTKSSGTVTDDLGLPHCMDDLGSDLDLACRVEQQLLLPHEQQQHQQIFLGDSPLSDFELEMLSAFIETPRQQQQQQQNLVLAHQSAQDQQKTHHCDVAAAAAAAEDQKVLERSRSIEQQIHQQMQGLASSSAAAADPAAAAAAAVLNDLDHHDRMELLGRLFALETLKQVLSLSAEQLSHRLRELVGQCAILSFQGDAASQYWHMPASAAATQSPAAKSSSSGSASDFTHASADSPRPACSGGSGGASGGSSSSFAAVEMFTFHPAFEFISIQLGTMLFDPEKWQQLRLLEMRSHACYDVLPAGHWHNVAEKLDLSDEQVRRLNILRTLTLPKLSSVAADLADATTQQHIVIEAQLEQLQKLSLHDKQQQQQQHTALWELQQQQESLIAQQESRVLAFHQIGLTIGIGSMVILTYKQLALFIAAAYPSSPRMDMLMSAVATLPRYQQQQEQLPQQQQQQCKTNQELAKQCRGKKCSE